MYANYTTFASPENSFVKFTHPAQVPCSTNILTCLPYLEETDISFQIKIRRGWVLTADWEDDLDTVLAPNYEVKATTSCLSGDALTGDISPAANRTEVIRRILTVASRYAIPINIAYELTNFKFTLGGVTTNIVVPNLVGGAAVTFLQNALNTSYPTLLVEVSLVGSTFYFMSSNPLFVAVEITTRHLVGIGYQLNFYPVTITESFCEYEVVYAYDFATLTISAGVDSTFTLAIIDASNIVSHCSNCFCVIDENNCYTSVLEYYGDEIDSLGFTYGHNDLSGNYIPVFRNRIRLALYLAYPQYPEEAEVYRRSSGIYEKIAARVEEVYEVQTDYMPREWHKCISIAMAHDQIRVQCLFAGLSDFTNVVLEEKVAVDWNKDRPYFPTAKSNFKVKTMPFNNYNSNLI